MIAWKYCVGFCHTMWISHKDTYVPSLLNLTPALHHLTALGCHRVPGSAHCATQHLPISHLFCIWQVWISELLSRRPSPSYPMAFKVCSLRLRLYSHRDRKDKTHTWKWHLLWAATMLCYSTQSWRQFCDTAVPTPIFQVRICDWKKKATYLETLLTW